MDFQTILPLIFNLQTCEVQNVDISYTETRLQDYNFQHSILDRYLLRMT